jgi:methylenetetrahydrofolate dehydrogenase (NADP+)/methenyltetrahydrofolate cyclohydrolase
MLLSGKDVADHLQEELRQSIQKLTAPPGLAVIIVGNNPSSQTYVAMKRKACAAVGIHSFFHPLPETISANELLKLIDQLNHDPTVDGILVQFPLPAHINSEIIIEAIDPHKDVDGFHPINVGKLLLGLKGGFIPCTPLGIKTLLERYQIPMEGKDVVIVGRSSIVGRPLAALLMQNVPTCNATVTVVHSKTADLKAHTSRADILVAAIGSPCFITHEMVKEGAVVIDVGINRIEDRKASNGFRLVGDVDFKHVENKCFAITPVPKGVGPMTVAMLLHNTFLSYQRSSM